MRTRFWSSLLALCLCLPLPVQGLENGGRGSGIALPETAETRVRLRGELYAPAASFGALSERVYTQADGRRVQLRLETQGEHLYYLFLAEAAGLFSVAGRGNYVVKKSLADGKFVQIKVFLRDHPGCFLRLYPAGGKSSLEVVLFGVRVYKDVPVALPLESWLTEPLSRLMKLSAALVDWGRLLEGGPVRGEPPAVARIRAALPTLPDGEDGALNEQGALVLIDSGEPGPAGGGLNCSGFAKWVVDGFRLGRRAPMLAIEPLKAKHMELRGNRWSLPLEDRRDPYFGLDWSRNLAASAWALEGLAAQDPEEFDVRREEFLRYREDVGFPVEELELLSFLEASDSPGEYYLGSVNTDYGGQPTLRQHVHLVVLFPYFSAAGELRVVVFERGRETSLAAVAARYPGSYVHLVRLPAGASFLAPGFVGISPLDSLPSVR